MQLKGFVHIQDYKRSTGESIANLCAMTGVNRDTLRSYLKRGAPTSLLTKCDGRYVFLAQRNRKDRVNSRVVRLYPLTCFMKRHKSKSEASRELSIERQKLSIHLNRIYSGKENAAFVGEFETGEKRLFMQTSIKVN